MNKLTLLYAALFLAPVVRGDDAKEAKGPHVQKSTEVVVAKDDTAVSEQEYLDAVREAKAARFKWECDDTDGQIQQGGDAAKKKETGRASRRRLDMGVVRDLGRYREMLHRLRPTTLIVFGCENLDVLKGLTSLQEIYLVGCPALKNLDDMKGLTDLKRLDFRGCRALQSVDGLNGLPGLQRLYLGGCDRIPASALRELRAALPKIDITFPDGSKEPPQ